MKGSKVSPKTFELGSQGSLKECRPVGWVEGRLVEGEQNGQIPVHHADVEASGQQFVPVHSQPGLGLKSRKPSLDGAKALEQRQRRTSQRKQAENTSLAPLPYVLALNFNFPSVLLVHANEMR